MDSSPQELRDFANLNAMPAEAPASRRVRKLIVVLVVAGIVAVGAGFAVFIGGMMKPNGAYEQAMAHALADCRVQQALGTPLEAGWFVSGSVETSGPGGHADMTIPLRGGSGAGRLYVSATRAAEVWSLEALQLEVRDAGTRIDLLSAAACGPAPVAAGAEAAEAAGPADAAGPAPATPGKGAPMAPAAAAKTPAGQPAPSGKP